MPLPNSLSRCDIRRPHRKSLCRRPLFLVSFSMPEVSLERLARDAKDAGIPLVFRGVPETKPSSDSKLPLLNPQSLAAFQPLIESGADVQFNPELFSEFNVRQVPALIIREEAPLPRTGASKALKPSLFPET